MPEDGDGRYKFRSFVRDERQMAMVFQNFLRNFIEIECKDWSVKGDFIKWDASSTSDPSLGLLPRMETDISLRRGGDLLIVDAKYYLEAMSKRHQTEKFKSGNLYQIVAYLHNASKMNSGRISGMLIYPEVDRAFDFRYKIHGYDICLRTINLNQHWSDLKNELIAIFNYELYFSAAA